MFKLVSQHDLSKLQFLPISLFFSSFRLPITFPSLALRLTIDKIVSVMGNIHRVDQSLKCHFPNDCFFFEFLIGPPVSTPNSTASDQPKIIIDSARRKDIISRPTFRALLFSRRNARDFLFVGGVSLSSIELK